MSVNTAGSVRVYLLPRQAAKPPPALDAPPMSVIGDRGVDVSSEKDGGVAKRIVRRGNPLVGTPRDGMWLTMHYKGSLLDGTEFYNSREKSFRPMAQLGVLYETLGLDLALRTMCRGEVADVVVRADYAYGEAGDGDSVPPGATVRYEIELDTWNEVTTPRDQLTATTRREWVVTLRDRARELYDLQQWAAARERYRDAAVLLEEDLPEGDLPEADRTLLLALRLNEAQSALKDEDFHVAEAAAGKALDSKRGDVRSVKAWYRRGAARVGLGMYECAAEDFRAALAIEPNNRKARARCDLGARREM